MWKIFEKKTLLKRIPKIPKHVLKHYEVWKRIIELSGPHGLKKIRGFNDEALKGSWKGYRSSRLTQQWRVIYSVNNQAVEIFVVDINAHDYKKR